MIAETSDQIKEFCIESVGDDLRGVITFTAEGLQSRYVREDIEHHFADLSTDSFLNPILPLHKAGWRLTQVFDHVGPPQSSIHLYQDILIFTFPLNESDGILVSLEKKESYLSNLLPDLEAIVHESEITT